MAAAVDAAIARADAVVEAAAAENADAGPIPFTRCTCWPVCFDFDFKTSIAADSVVQGKTANAGPMCFTRCVRVSQLRLS